MPQTTGSFICTVAPKTVNIDCLILLTFKVVHGRGERDIGIRFLAGMLSIIKLKETHMNSFIIGKIA